MGKENETSQTSPKESRFKTKSQQSSGFKPKGQLKLSPLLNFQIQFPNKYSLNVKDNIELVPRTKLSDIPTLNNSKIAEKSFISQNSNLTNSQRKKPKRRLAKKTLLKKQCSDMEIPNGKLKSNTKSSNNMRIVSQGDSSRDLALRQPLHSNDAHLRLDVANLTSFDRNDLRGDGDAHNIYECFYSNEDQSLDENYFKTEEDIKQFIDYDILRESDNSSFLLESTTGFHKAVQPATELPKKRRVPALRRK